MPLAMDSLNYHYYKGTNQLAQVNDAVPAPVPAKLSPL